MKVIQEELGEDDDNKKAIIEFEKVINEKNYLIRLRKKLNMKFQSLRHHLHILKMEELQELT